MKRIKDMTDDEVRDLPGGPYPKYAAQDTAERAAEAIRLLNYLSLPQDGAPGLRWPADLYDIVASLKVAAMREPQTFRQMSLWLGEQHAAGKVAHDSGEPAGGHVAAVRAALDTAEDAAGVLAEALNRVHNALAGLRAST
jgi:hypothetical protein